METPDLPEAISIFVGAISAIRAERSSKITSDSTGSFAVSYLEDGSRKVDGGFFYGSIDAIREALQKKKRDFDHTGMLVIDQVLTYQVIVAQNHADPYPVNAEKIVEALKEYWPDMTVKDVLQSGSEIRVAFGFQDG